MAPTAHSPPIDSCLQTQALNPPPLRRPLSMIRLPASVPLLDRWLSYHPV